MEKNILNLIIEEIKKSSIPISMIARKCGLSRQFIYKIKNGQIKSITTETLVLLCNALNISVDDLLNETTTTTETHIPVYGEIPAGIPTDMIDSGYIEDYEDIDAVMLVGGRQYFGLKVKGESMLPEFRPGDVLIIEKTPDCITGDYCAVSINCTESTFKKVIRKENGIVLQPLNPIFEPIFYTNKEIDELPITILGKVVEVRRSIK